MVLYVKSPLAILTLDVVESQLAYLNQIPEGINPLKTMPDMPNEAPNLAIVSQGETEFSPLGKFQIEGLSPSKMAKVSEVLSALDIKVYSKRKNKYLGSRKKRRMVKDFCDLRIQML